MPATDRQLLVVEDLHVSFDTPKGVVEAVRGVDLELGGEMTFALDGPINLGGGIRLLNSSIILQNSIVWGNMPQDLLAGADSQPLISYCDIADVAAGHFDAPRQILQIQLGTAGCGGRPDLFPDAQALVGVYDAAGTVDGMRIGKHLRSWATRPELFIRKTDFNTTVRMPHVSEPTSSEPTISSTPIICAG